MVALAALGAFFGVVAARAYLTPPPAAGYPALSAPAGLVGAIPAARCHRVLWLDAASVVPATVSPGLPAAWRDTVVIVLLPCR